MQRLEITGNTPEELYFNVVKTLTIFLRGAQPTPSSDNGSSEVTPHDGSTPSEGTTTGLDKVIARAKDKKGKAKVEKLVPDEIGDLGVKTIEHEPKALTLDGDIRPRLRAIQVACTERKMDMPSTIQYIQKLYGPFGIAKAEQLKPEQFAEFMEASDGYLSGEA